MSRGVIAYCTREDHAPPLFASHLAKLAQRHPDSEILPVVGNDIASNRNHAVRALRSAPDLDWIWFIDTDMLFAPTTIQRLLAWDVAIVQMHVLMRHPPHKPVIWQADSTTQLSAPPGRPRLIEVPSVGAGGTLYRRHVFERVADPWFEGVIGKEDTTFAQKARAAGFTLHVDLTTPAWHQTPVLVSPVYVNGIWLIEYKFSNGQTVHVPFEGSPIQPATADDLARLVGHGA